MTTPVIDRPAVVGPIELPFPTKLLWPNGRAPHWGARARAVKQARRLAWGVALEALRRRRLDWTRVRLNWTVYPKTAHRIDDDAPPFALKAYRDGIADALGTDDSNFTATYSIGSPVKGGAVRVTLEQA